MPELERRHEDTRERLIRVEGLVESLTREVREYRALTEQRMVDQIAALQKQINALREALSSVHEASVQRREFVMLQRVVLALVVAVAVVYIGRPDWLGRVLAGLLP